MMLRSAALLGQRSSIATTLLRRSRGFADTATHVRPIRKSVSPEERAALRAARKERAMRTLEQQGQASSGGGGQTGAPSVSLASNAKYMIYASVFVPAALLTWAIKDPDSPPAQFSKMIGLTDMILGVTDEFSKPAHDKLLPNWQDMPNVPQDIFPLPHTLVLDLENTLVSSTWDRKYGWRHAKRPGVDRFLQTMVEYYEIVLYSPSPDYIGDPVVTALDKKGCIQHRLYRDATHYHNGVHVKDLDRLNRPTSRMIVLDDNPDEVQFNPDNLLRIKPYDDPNDRTDDALERITPFLVSIARGGYNDVPAILRQFKGMDSDQVADEFASRIDQYKNAQERRVHAGLGRFVGGAGGGNLPEPELTPTASYDTSQQLTAKDLVGSAPPTSVEDKGMLGWMNRRAKEKEEHNQRKMEKWHEVMMKKQQEKKEKAAAAAN